jgi:hypothetical protein
MNAFRSIALGIAIASALITGASAQTVTMTVGNTNMTPTEDGFYSALVTIQVAQSPNTGPAVPYIQVRVPHVKTPEEATANLRDPVIQYLDVLKTTAQSLPHR